MKKYKKITELRIDIEQQLLTVYDDPVLCKQYAWWTLETITQLTKAELITRDQISFSLDQEIALKVWLERLIIHKEPIQYLIGSVPFCEVDIIVQPPILIPRPETEEWCSNLIDQLKNLRNEKITILDLCCGSGCIAIALARALPQAIIYAVDISEIAIALTKKNIEHNAITNVTVLQSDLFSQLSSTIKYDIIVTNPPYIADCEWSSLDESVRRWEDRNALCAPEDGLAIIKKIINQAPFYISLNEEIVKKSISQLMIEIGYQQGPVVSILMRQAGYTKVHVAKDLEDKDRLVSGVVPFVF